MLDILIKECVVDEIFPLEKNLGRHLGESAEVF